VQVRSITREEIEPFSAFSSVHDRGFAPTEPGAFAEWLLDLWEWGGSQPERCFVAEEAGQLRGSVVYYADDPVHVEHLALHWHNDYLDVGVPLLRHSLWQLRAHGVAAAYAMLASPPLTEQERLQRAELLEQAGFTLTMQGLRWEWLPDAPPPSGTGRLTFRTLAEVGEAAWNETERRVSLQSLDPTLEPPPHTENAAADELNRSWWQLGYDEGGELVGLIKPSLIDGGRNAVIEFIGVVPERRGHGYVDDLLAQGLTTLQAAGRGRIRADTHIQNVPMQRAFQRAGFRNFATRRVYNLDLTDLTET
jgi:RimJ/RimL family protein N-acetyltransferase